VAVPRLAFRSTDHCQGPKQGWSSHRARLWHGAIREQQPGDPPPPCFALIFGAPRSSFSAVIHASRDLCRLGQRQEHDVVGFVDRVPIS
jgi:hypothetical protein